MNKLNTSDIINEFNGVYSGIPTAEFIKKRNGHVGRTNDPSETNKYRRWDCEFPENDIVNHIKSLTIFEGINHDNEHEKYGNLDFKIFARNGVKLSEFVQTQVEENNIDYFVIWKWVKHWDTALEEEREYSYEILGMIDAKKAAAALRRVGSGYRFIFPVPGLYI